MNSKPKKIKKTKIKKKQPPASAKTFLGKHPPSKKQKKKNNFSPQTTFQSCRLKLN